jgi:hypothetical protein
MAESRACVTARVRRGVVPGYVLPALLRFEARVVGAAVGVLERRPPVPGLVARRAYTGCVVASP